MQKTVSQNDQPSTTATSFDSHGTRCAAWLTLPDGQQFGCGPYSAVLLIHGFGATHEMALPFYEAAFAAAGMAVASFDFRRIGASDGLPRQRFSVTDMLADSKAALTWVRSLPEVDTKQVALWGTSFGASHAMSVAASDPDVAAVVLNCPMIDCLNAALQMSPGHLMRLTPSIISDTVRGVLGLNRKYIPLVVEPGELGMIAAPGARSGWYSIQPQGLDWDNRVNAGFALAMLNYRAVKHAARIACPMLVSVCKKENLMSPKVAETAAQAAPKGEAVYYEADHFEVYHLPLREQIIADQVEFLTQSMTALGP